MSELRSAEEYPLGQGELRWTCTEWLEENLDGDFVLLDCQPNIHDYIQEHIPGAVYFNPELLRVPKGGIPGKYIPSEAAGKLFRRVGVRNNEPVIVYTGTGPFKGWGDGLEQTMIAYSLLRFGAKDVWLLDGGIDSWKHEGRALDQAFPEVEKSECEVDVQEDFYLSYEQFKQVKNDEGVILLDARPADVYQGQGPWSKPGHIPGAVKAILDEHGITRDHRVICSCGTGREATAEFTIFKYLLGFANVKIYEGSFTEWCHYDEPTVTGPDPR